MKRKSGEAEAMAILKSKGIEFDETYCDDNSQSSMPDLKYMDGRFLEVTHTLHNNNMVKCPNRYARKSVEEKLKIASVAEKAYVRFQRRCYPQDNYGNLTSEGKEQFRADRTIIKNHLGYDICNRSNFFNEFKCDLPTIICSSDNIIREILKDKGDKHFKGDTDLFIFILQEEFNSVKYLLDTRQWNGCSAQFINAIIKSVFKVIYLCVWSFETQTYNTENPVLLKFETTSEEELIIKFM